MGAAVDARGFNAGEEPAVETGIAQADRAVASTGVGSSSLAAALTGGSQG
jgi:hypothetical protein